MMNRSGQLPNLEKLFKDDDEEDFTPLGGSNLAAIFDNPLKPSDINSSLKIQQQKRTVVDKNLVQPSPIASKTKVIVAKVVYAYKLQNGQYNLIGRLNIALTGNIATNAYILILYRNKTEHISVAKLTFNFSYSVCENNYATYYDSNNENWSILFENTEACIELAREIGISKYFLRQDKADENVIYQDLTASSEGEEAKQDDKVSVKYSIITSITQPLKINTGGGIQNSVVEITTDNNWEKSLVGTKKNLKRLLFLSPSKQISLGPGFPRDKDIALEIEITDIIRPEPPQIPSPNSITSSEKASLISRMAKMGRSMLPKLPSSTTTDSDDTEEEVHVKSPRRLRNAELPDGQKKSPQSQKPSPSIEQSTDISIASGHSRGGQQNTIPTSAVANPHGTIVSTKPYPNVWGTPPIQQQYIYDGRLYPIQSTLPQPMSTATDPNINVFLSESRTHNAEIRMGMSKIADNVQKLIDKFHVLEIQNATSPNNEKAFESSLKMLLALKNDKVDNEIMETNKNSKMNDVQISQEELKKLKDDLESTKNSLTESLSRLEAVETEKRNINAEKLELEAEILTLKLSLTDSQYECKCALSDLKKSDALAMKYQKDNAKLEANIMSLNEKTRVLGNAMASNKNIPVNQNEKAAEIKQIMNKTYQTLITKFTDDSYTTDYIKATVAKTIKAITLQVLKEDKSIAENHAFNDLLIKEATQNSSRIESEDDNINVPDVDENSILGINKQLLSAVQHEPPPIPPMDPDVEGDWSL